ncbi:MAG: peroxiredoxin [Nitrososphaerota archaeon]|nr:peroxiredoxin [Candidatus Calditenuaceae archaeon]MDW8073704.1 peroxiredoxin [Nitrososphaerota archaeon]
MKVGDDCPDFSLPSTEGEFRLKEKLGKDKYIILYFYPRDDTPGCTAEACSFRDNMGVLTNYGAEVYGISTDSLESHKKFIQKYGLTFPLLSDRGAEVARLFDAYNSLFKAAKRKTFIISPEGKIAKIIEGVKPDEHVRLAREFLERRVSQRPT